MTAQPQDTETRFYELIDSCFSENEAEKKYARRAHKRGWLTLQHLPPGSDGMKLLDVGSMKGLFGPAYVDLWNYGEVHLLALLKKESFTPLNQLKNRYPSPLYQPLFH